MNTEQMIRLYRKRAKNYNWTANLYYLIGFREWRQRKEAVQSLGLHAGDTVVEIGCGTGLNFGLLREAVGASGKIIGVDATDAMLAQAKRRVQNHDWSNVTLVLSDARSFRFLERAAGVLSTYALSIIPNAQDVLERGERSLKEVGRLSVLDLQVPERIPTVEARNIVRENREIAQIIMPREFNKGEKSEGQKPVDLPQGARP